MLRYEDINRRIMRLNKQIGGNWIPEFQLLWILEELGEVNRELLFTQQIPGKSRNLHHNGLKVDIGDVPYGLSSLCNSLYIDFLDALNASVYKFEIRHKPVEKQYCDIYVPSSYAVK